MAPPVYPPTIVVVSATATVTSIADPVSGLALVPLPGIVAAPVAPQAAVGDLVIVLASLRLAALVEDSNHAVGAVIATVAPGDALVFAATSNRVWVRVSPLCVPLASLPLPVPT